MESLYLRIDKPYRNTNNWKNPEDEFNKYFRFSDGKGINNVSGFRPKSHSLSKDTDINNCAFCVLITNLGEIEWPDNLDLETGQFTYYGDNRVPGAVIDFTPVGGNRLLQTTFSNLHTQSRELIKPFLCFESIKRDGKSYMKFLGLAAPGEQGVSSLEDLVAVWKIKGQQRFQNYRSIFTIFNEEAISRFWLDDMVAGVRPIDSANCPKSWTYWVETGIYNALQCKNEVNSRSKNDQLLATNEERRVLEFVVKNLSDREFEYASAEIVRLLDTSFRDLLVTRATKDGGRDVIGYYYLGHSKHQVRLSVFIEAKKWKQTSAIGVKPMMRLISRLRHRDVGVFVTTSYFDKQIQNELIEDGHPVMLISGGDISKILINSDLSSSNALSAWVEAIKQKSSE